MTAVLRLQHVSVPMPADGHDAARGFYGDALGMTEVAPPSTLRAGSVVWFQAGEDGQEVHVYVEAGGGPNTPSQHLCLQVADLAEFRERLDGRGIPVEETVPIVNRPRDFVRDPFGNLIELTQITGDYTLAGGRGAIGRERGRSDGGCAGTCTLPARLRHSPLVPPISYFPLPIKE